MLTDMADIMSTKISTGNCCGYQHAWTHFTYLTVIRFYILQLMWDT
jgi:hypothetical protein